MVGRKKSRHHFRDESDQLLGLYSDQISKTTSQRDFGNALYVPPSDASSNGGNGNNGGNGYNYNLMTNTIIKRLSPTHFFNSNFPPQPPKSPTKKYKKHHHRKESIDDNLSVLTTTSSSAAYYYPNSPMIRSPQHHQHQRNHSNNTNNHHHHSSDHYKIHRVSYMAQNHIQILFQMYGSAFPSIVPFCCINIIWTLIVELLKNYSIVDLTFHSSDGHSFMGLLVSFLIVSRSQISYGRFMEYRNHLSTCYSSCREIIQLTTTYTYFLKSSGAQQWRSEIGYHTILLLRVTMDALLWSSTERSKWEDEYYQYHPDTDSNDYFEISNDFFVFNKQLTHGRRSNIDENMRAPIAYAHTLRQIIMKHPEYFDDDDNYNNYKMPMNEYRDLVLLVENFLDAFHGFRLLIFTPYPFPLVQMTRAFLFFWVYSLPLVLLSENQYIHYRLLSSLIIITFVTFGFIGLEYVSIALDDPFGDETNDIDEHGMSLLVYEDIYLSIYRTDGPTSATILRNRVIERYKLGRELYCYRQDLKSSKLFWDPYGNNDNNNNNAATTTAFATNNATTTTVATSSTQQQQQQHYNHHYQSSSSSSSSCSRSRSSSSSSSLSSDDAAEVDDVENNATSNDDDDDDHNNGRGGGGGKNNENCYSMMMAYSSASSSNNTNV